MIHPDKPKEPFPFLMVKDGWLKERIAAAQKEMLRWPEWMRQAAKFEELP